MNPRRFLRSLALLAIASTSCADDERPGAHTSGVEVRYHVADRLVSAALVLDARGEVVARTSPRPFGEPWIAELRRGATGPVHRFTGHEDELGGGVSIGARHYLPALGRFSAPDRLWLDLVPDELEPWLTQSDPYALAANDPVDRVDLDGHVAPIVTAGVGAVVGAGFEVARSLARGEAIRPSRVAAAAVLGAGTAGLGALALATGYTAAEATLIAGTARGLTSMVRSGFEEQGSQPPEQIVGHMVRDGAIGFANVSRAPGTSRNAIIAEFEKRSVNGALRSTLRAGARAFESFLRSKIGGAPPAGEEPYGRCLGPPPR